MAAMLNRGLIFIVITLITHNVFCQSERLKFLSGDSVNLEKLATETKPVLLDFYASWCGPCKQMDQTVFSHPRIYTYLNENVVFVKINIDTDIGKVLKKKYSIRAFPTYVLLKEGSEIRRKVGKVSRRNFLDWVTSP